MHTAKVRNLLISLCAVTIVVGLSVSPTRADDFSFNAGANQDWTDAANWLVWDGMANVAANSVPTNSDNVIVEGTDHVIVSGTASAIGGNLVMDRFSAEQNAIVEVTGGTLSVAGTFHMADADFPSTVATLKISGGEVNLGFLRATQGVAKLEMTGGRLKIANNFEFPGLAWTGVTRQASASLEGGIMEVEGGFSLKGDDGKTGHFNITGGTLSLKGDKTAAVQGLVTDGLLSGYGVSDLQHVNISFNIAQDRTFVTAVPEPTSVGMVIVGMLAALGQRRNRRQ